MNNLTLKCLREGSNVKRCHTLPIIGEYTVGKHSYDATNIVLLFHPNPSMNLVKAVLWHDQAERWTGDVPSPAKNENSTLKNAYEAAEKNSFKRSGIEIPKLTKEEQLWLDAVDKLDLLLWAREQDYLGNKNANGWASSLENWFDQNKEEVPKELWAVFKEYTPERLPENLRKEL